MRIEEFNEQLHFAYDSEPTRTNKEAASCCRGCAYEVRCERDTSWRGHCPDYAEYATGY
jgi:hypothetical protein